MYRLTLIFCFYNRRQTVKAIRLVGKTFSICVRFKLNSFNGDYALVDDWTNPWLFLFEILRSNQLRLTFRRNGVRGATWDMVSFTGGNVATTHNWQTACADWDQKTGTAYIYLNGALVGLEKTPYTPYSLQQNNHASFQVGWKGDSNNQYCLLYTSPSPRD